MLKSRQALSTLFLLRRLLCFVACSLLLAPCSALAWSGVVIGISDGDTITVLQDERRPVKIRLYGIDCPEKRQAWGNRATQGTRRLCYDKVVDVEEAGLDRYGRIVAIIILPDGSSLQERLVEEGLAWVWPRYCKLPICQEWAAGEATAREAGVGLWRDKDPVQPWEWRRNARASQRPVVSTNLHK